MIYDNLPPTEKPANPVHLFSFGGGVQSTAILVMQSMGLLETPYDLFVFSNVGDDSENPATLKYIRDVTIPYATAHNIPFKVVQKTRFGEPETLLEAVKRDNRTIPIPARTNKGAPGKRGCTLDFKIRVIDRFVKTSGYTHAVIGIGISLDEFTRVKSQEWHNTETTGNTSKKLGFWRRREYPLIDKRFTRDDCLGIISRVGLPMPPKSSCWFCPFLKHGDWLDRLQNDPALFVASIGVESIVNAKREKLGKDHLYLHSSGKPLAEAVKQTDSPSDDDYDLCDNAGCMT